MPKRRAASRWLSPSTWQAWRTRPSSSTENIPALSGPWRASPKKAMTRYSFVPARPDYPVASVAYFSSAALTSQTGVRELAGRQVIRQNRVPSRHLAGDRTPMPQKEHRYMLLRIVLLAPLMALSVVSGGHA